MAKNVDAAKECTVFCEDPAILFPPYQRASAMVAPSVGVRRCVRTVCRVVTFLAIRFCGVTSRAASTEQSHFEQRVRPLLKLYCYDCLMNGES